MSRPLSIAPAPASAPPKSGQIRHDPYAQGVRIGMVVNDMAEVNVDAKLVRDDPNAQGAGADSVELQNGCICW